MRYSTENMQISVTLHLAAHLRANGFAVYWQTDGTTEERTAGPDRGTITLVPDFPANPSFIVRLRSENGGPEEILVPALAVQVLDEPQRGAILGIGHKEYEWERNILVDGFSADDRQHRLLADLLHDWLESEKDKPIPVFDYSVTPDTPTALEPARVESSNVKRSEHFTDIEAIRYYVRASARLTYVE